MRTRQIVNKVQLFKEIIEIYKRDTLFEVLSLHLQDTQDK